MLGNQSQLRKGRLHRRAFAYSHLLGECGVSIFGSERLARIYRRRFPSSLDQAPFLLPSGDSGLRLSLEEWFRRHNARAL